MPGVSWLDDHPPARSQFRRPRRKKVTGCIVKHTAENTPDFVAFDGGAEAVAKFVAARPDPGSYHTIGDSDSRIRLVDFDCEAYGDGTGSNPWALHYSTATRADVWPLAPQAWRDGAVEQAAQGCAEMARWVHDQTGIVVPARRITRAQSEAGQPGFITHAERDPARRHDPGAGYPWGTFLDRYAALTTDLGNHQEDYMPLGKDIHSDRRGEVSRAYLDLLGRPPRPDEIAPGAAVDQWVLVLAGDGLDVLLNRIAASDEANKRRAQIDALLTRKD